MAASALPSSATNRLQPLSTSSGMRTRNFASRKLLAASRPVEAQLFIQTRAISSYSSGRAGRIVGGAIQSVPDSNVAVFGARKKPATISRVLLQLNQERNI